MKETKCYICDTNMNIPNDKYVKIKDKYICKDCFENKRNRMLSILHLDCDLNTTLVVSYDLYLNGRHLGNTISHNALNMITDLDGVKTNIDGVIDWGYR